MSKANEPAYPTSGYHEGTTKREKLAMEIYASKAESVNHEAEFNQASLKLIAAFSLRAADIFFEVMEKDKK